MAGQSTNIRTSDQDIVQKRGHKSCTILVTGGTGFIGSHVAIELLRNGYSVLLLARRQKSLSAKKRVGLLLDWFGVDRRDRARCEVIEGHLDDPTLGLDTMQYANLAGTVDEIVHCASNTSFSERKREAVRKANVTNLENVLAFAARSRCYFLHLMSTAYVAGRRRGPCREEMVETREFLNVYEETKYLAERNAWSRCQNEGIRLNIYRPSIVYGDSRDGRTLLFNGLYYPIRTVVFFSRLYEQDIDEHGGRKAREMGVRRDENGKLYLPLRVEATVSGGINLIPIDYLIKAFMAIMEHSLGGDVFHIVNTKLTTIESLAEYAKRFFHIEGIRAVPDAAFAEIPRNGLEILFDHYVEAYGPYIRDQRVFENCKTDAILGKTNTACPNFDYGVFSKCMRYAVNVNWGAELFDIAKQDGTGH